MAAVGDNSIILHFRFWDQVRLNLSTDGEKINALMLFRTKTIVSFIKDSETSTTISRC